MNPFEPLNSDDMVQNIKDILHCPFCGADYTASNIRVMDSFKKTNLIYLFCKNCKNSIMASVSYQDNRFLQGFAEQKEKLDVQFPELAHFMQRGKINDSDVMDFYQALKNIDGNFRDLISESNKSKRGMKGI